MNFKEKVEVVTNDERLSIQELGFLIFLIRVYEKDNNFDFQKLGFFDLVIKRNNDLTERDYRAVVKRLEGFGYMTMTRLRGACKWAVNVPDIEGLLEIDGERTCNVYDYPAIINK